MYNRILLCHLLLGETASTTGRGVAAGGTRLPLPQWRVCARAVAKSNPVARLRRRQGEAILLRERRSDHLRRHILSGLRRQPKAVRAMVAFARI